MKTFLYVLNNILDEKYSHIDFEFYLSRCTKNIHMGLNYSLLGPHEQNQIIFDIKELWLWRRQDTSFKFTLPQPIHTTNRKFNYIIFKKISILGKYLEHFLDVLTYIKELMKARSAMIFGLKRLNPMGKQRLDLAMAITKGCYGRIVGRS